MTALSKSKKRIKKLISQLDSNTIKCVICKKHKDKKLMSSYTFKNNYCLSCLNTKGKLAKHLSKGIR